MGKRSHPDLKGDNMNKTILSPQLLMVLFAGFVTAEEDQKKVALFDGKTFDGWEGNLEVFRIEKGAAEYRPIERVEKWDRHLATAVIRNAYRPVLGANPIFQRPAMPR